MDGWPGGRPAPGRRRPEQAVDTPSRHKNALNRLWTSVRGRAALPGDGSSSGPHPVLIAPRRSLSREARDPTGSPRTHPPRPCGSRCRRPSSRGPCAAPVRPVHGARERRTARVRPPPARASPLRTAPQPGRSPSEAEPTAARNRADSRPETDPIAFRESSPCRESAPPRGLTALSATSGTRSGTRVATAAVRIRREDTAVLHRLRYFLASTSWGLRSCPDLVHRRRARQLISPVQVPVDAWTNDLHRLWTKQGPTEGPCRCPPATHRLWAIVPSDRRLLHTAVHCSARRACSSLSRVKGVTPRCRVGLWGTWVNLGTALGRSAPTLCIGCAELFPVHSAARLSTAAAHKASGQKTGPHLLIRGYPRYPQPLLLLPTRES